MEKIHRYSEADETCKWSVLSAMEPGLSELKISNADWFLFDCDDNQTGWNFFGTQTVDQLDSLLGTYLKN